MIEEWKKIVIKNVDTGYEISNLGNLKHLGSIIEPKVGANGYKRISIGGEPITIHRLVAALFVKRKNMLAYHVHHIDGNKLNNSAGNLMWLTPLEHNKIHQISNMKCLSNDEVTQICELVKENKLNYSSIADKVGVEISQVYDIVNGNTYTSITTKYLPYLDNYKFKNMKRDDKYIAELTEKIANRESRADVIKWMIDNDYEPDRIVAERYYDNSRRRYLASIDANMAEEDARCKYRESFAHIEQTILDGKLSRTDTIKMVMDTYSMPYMKAKDLVKQRRTALIKRKATISTEGREADIERIKKECKEVGHKYDHYIPFIKEHLACDTPSCEIVKMLVEQYSFEKTKAKNLVQHCKNGMQIDLLSEDPMYAPYIPTLEYKIIKGERNNAIKDWLVRGTELDEASIETIIKFRRKLLKEGKGVINSLRKSSKVAK